MTLSYIFSFLYVPQDTIIYMVSIGPLKLLILIHTLTGSCLSHSSFPSNIVSPAYSNVQLFCDLKEVERNHFGYDVKPKLSILKNRW